MGLLRHIATFFIRYPVVAALMLIAATLGIAGNLQTAFEWWQAGPRGWLMQLAGWLLFIGVIVVVLARWDYERKIIRHSDAPSPPSAKSPEATKRAADHNLSSMIDRVLTLSRPARSARNKKRAAELALPEMEAALLTLEKERGISIPKKFGDPNLDLEAACRLMELIEPMIRRGHDDEARKRSEEFRDRFDPDKKGRSRSSGHGDVA